MYFSISFLVKSLCSSHHRHLIDLDRLHKKKKQQPTEIKTQVARQLDRCACWGYYYE